MEERRARLGGRKGETTCRGLWHAEIKQNHYSGRESCIHFTTDLDRFFNVAGEEEVESIRPDAGPCLEHGFPTPLETRRVQSLYMGLRVSQEQETGGVSVSTLVRRSMAGEGAWSTCKRLSFRPFFFPLPPFSPNTLDHRKRPTLQRAPLRAAYST